ncbi:ABC-2 type transporter [Candidatus Competibacter denitrificans Run_A_D11]|uniref:Transport permease protein n=1 Tax=Candidatus Competibacter denitrificans Run_A_D11 TaxID=1400863 RepID=W6M631_9GAMM|nr:ABC transporter permease [Candidatus Competibacter denitrificans]CDI03386.1 ABC-2 type transporter [Candidatus Competibacter denitrificans Run_A_D11]
MNSQHYRQVVEIRPSKGLFDLELGLVWQYRELLYFLLMRDLKVRYKQAALGAGWAIIQPIIATLIFTLVFGVFVKVPSDGLPYTVFAFTALLPWTLFAESLRRGGISLVGDSALIQKIYFPRLVIPLATALTALVDFLISLLMLFVLLLWYSIPLTLNIVFLPFFIFFTVVLAFSFGLWLGPLNIKFRDVQHIIPFLLQIWMYACPIVYPLSIIPEKYRWLYNLNPMVGVIEGFRWSLLGKENAEFQAIWITVIFVLLLLFGGVVYFKKMERSFADLI